MSDCSTEGSEVKGQALVPSFGDQGPGFFVSLDQLRQERKAAQAAGLVNPSISHRTDFQKTFQGPSALPHYRRSLEALAFRCGYRRDPQLVGPPAPGSAIHYTAADLAAQLRLENKIRRIQEDQALLKTRRPKIPESAEIQALPGAFRIKPNFPPPKKDGSDPDQQKRGQVQGMSAASKKRLMLELVRLDWDNYRAKGKAMFVTLTYPDQFPKNPDGSIDQAMVARDLDVMGKRLARQSNFAGLIWRKEFVPRKSGSNEGKWSPHFHILIFWHKRKNITRFRRWISAAWHKVIRTDDIKHLAAGTNVLQVHGSEDGKLFTYLSKYLAKEGGEKFFTGRVWGKIGNPPQGIVARYRLPVWSMIALVRRVRAWARSTGRPGRLRHIRVQNAGLIFGAGQDLSWLLRGLPFEILEDPPEEMKPCQDPLDPRIAWLNLNCPEWTENHTTRRKAL